MEEKRGRLGGRERDASVVQERNDGEKGAGGTVREEPQVPGGRASIHGKRIQEEEQAWRGRG